MHLSKQKNSSVAAPDPGLAVLCAFGLDLLGEPPTRWHPVVWYGGLIRRLEQHAPTVGSGAQFCYGTGMLIVASPLVLLPTWLIKRGIASLNGRGRSYQQRVAVRWITALLLGTALKPFFALRMLAGAGRQVRLSLQRADLLAAREALQSLVSRERSGLSSELVAAATIESLAENLSDSVVAPLFYYACFGLPGAAIYRLYNTFDSMIGYHGKYEYLGKTTARLDDLLNLIPARITALLIIGTAPLFGGRRTQAWQIWRRDAGRTASPNAGQPMAAAAGALGVQLEKVDHYILGDRVQPLTADTLKRAERMVWIVGGLALVLTGLWQFFWSRRDKYYE